MATVIGPGQPIEAIQLLERVSFSFFYPISLKLTPFQMLIYDPSKRIAAKVALESIFFDDRKEVLPNFN